ncbi:MAG: hypothetical protein ABSE80_11420 [Halobacteriota archaeon]
MNNDQTEVEELILEIGTTKTTMPTWPPKNFLGSARPVGKLINTYGTERTIAGYPTAHANSYDGLSNGYKCRYISLVNTAGRMSSRDARVRG